MLLDIDTRLVCIKEHQDGNFTPGKTYKVSAHQGGGKNAGIRIRDDKRQRKDFNHIPTSKNYVWEYFKVSSEEGYSMPRYDYKITRASHHDVEKGIRQKYHGARGRYAVVKLFVLEGDKFKDAIILYVEDHTDSLVKPLMVGTTLFVQGFPMWSDMIWSPGEKNIGFNHSWPHARRVRWMLEDCPLVTPEVEHVAAQ